MTEEYRRFLALVASADEPLWPPDARVPVSPSKVDQVNTCSLRWALEAAGGTPVSSPQQSLGSLVHAIAEEHPTGDLAELTEALAEVSIADPSVKIHLYGKAVRPGRKLGHATATGDDLADVRRRARAAAALIESGAPDEPSSDPDEPSSDTEREDS